MQPTIGKENLLEKFLVMGGLEEEVEVLGQRIVLHVLTSGEQREVYERSTHVDVMARMRAIQHETLARAIIGINGNPITYVPKDKEEKIDEYKLIEQNLKTIQRANQAVIDEIFAKYEELVTKQNSQIDDLKKKLTSHGQETDGKPGNESESKTLSGPTEEGAFPSRNIGG